MKFLRIQHIALFLMLFSALNLSAQGNKKNLNRQYADMKKIHFGFSVGANFQDLNITNSRSYRLASESKGDKK